MSWKAKTGRGRFAGNDAGRPLGTIPGAEGDRMEIKTGRCEWVPLQKSSEAEIENMVREYFLHART